MDLQSQAKPTIVLVGNHPAVRDALSQFLEESGFSVLARTSGRPEALDVCSSRPDLILVDLSSDDSDALALIADMQESRIPVVVCSIHEEPEYVRRALDAGARAYVSERDSGQWLARTIRDVLDGWVMVSPRAADDLSSDP